MHVSMKNMTLGFLVLGLFAIGARAETLDEAVDGYLDVAAEDVFAQTAPKESPWDIKGGFGFTYRDGNTNVTNLAVIANADRAVGAKGLLKLYLQGLYTETEGVETGNEWIFLQRYEHSLNEKSRLWQQLWLETDSQESLALRWVLSLGYGYRLANTADEKFVMWGELGAGYRSDNFYGGADEGEAILQINVDWVWKITKTLTYKQLIQYWPSLSNGGEFLLVWNSTFSLPISEKWSFELIVQDKYNSQPVEGNEENDFAIILSLSFDFTKKKDEG